MGMRACDHVTLQGKRSPTDSGIPRHCGSGCCPSPATPSQLHSCKLTHRFADTTYACPAIWEGSVPPPGTAGWQDSSTQGQKGVWNWGKGEKSGYHHELRLGATVDASCRAPCSSGRRRLPLCIWALLFPLTAPPEFIYHQAAALWTLRVLCHCADLGLAGHMATETSSPCSGWSA